MTSLVEENILDALNARGEMRGLDSVLACAKCENRTWVLAVLTRLEADGYITIIRHGGGRGKKNIFKRNPNQQGQPRRRSRHA